MDRLKPMVDMAISPEDKAENMPVMANENKYPYGLSICLTQNELEKLDVDHEDWQVGDLFHLFAMARVTSISKNETESGEQCRVEMQIVALAGESEDAEADEYDDGA